MFPSHLALEAVLSFPRFYLLWVPGELAGQKPPRLEKHSSCILQNRGSILMMTA